MYLGEFSGTEAREGTRVGDNTRTRFSVGNPRHCYLHTFGLPESKHGRRDLGPSRAAGETVRSSTIEKVRGLSYSHKCLDASLLRAWKRPGTVAYTCTLPAND